jgi:hypothetical protein
VITGSYVNGAILGGVRTTHGEQNTAGTTEFFTRTPDGVIHRHIVAERLKVEG